MMLIIVDAGWCERRCRVSRQPVGHRAFTEGKSNDTCLKAFNSAGSLKTPSSTHVYFISSISIISVQPSQTTQPYPIDYQFIIIIPCQPSTMQPQTLFPFRPLNLQHRLHYHNGHSIQKIFADTPSFVTCSTPSHLKQHSSRRRSPIPILQNHMPSEIPYFSKTMPSHSYSLDIRARSFTMKEGRNMRQLGSIPNKPSHVDPSQPS